jgi:ABC-type dipeptide/oligopeptide/nickel transport system permease subunit
VELFVVGIGLTVGLLAGYRGGWVDTLLMRITDVMLAFPDVLLAILLLGTLGTAASSPAASMTLVIVALGRDRLATAGTTGTRAGAVAPQARVRGSRAFSRRDGRRIILKHILPRTSVADPGRGHGRCARA